MAGLIFVWFRGWLVVQDRAYGHLLARPEISDVGRALRFFGVFVGYPVMTAMVIACIALVADP